ncbi:hypothetical protein PoB_000380800 [Plakobranchus ocellatus]|uniref:Secreted protein n=1 Tax=Plakobranchus ocellatus TaxID=259542 RepID=A0AAV3Y540_9GAST|nr:hypothetical protein PoB_000380800 [Plakobranchus ocellatus]
MRRCSHCTMVVIPSGFCMWAAKKTASPTSSLPGPPKACTKARQSVKITTSSSEASSFCLLMTTLKHWAIAFNSQPKLQVCPSRGPCTRDFVPSGHKM